MKTSPSLSGVAVEYPVAAELSPLQKLERLRAKIVHREYLDNWREVCFWQEYDGVPGWQGTRDILFVGLNPSCGHFPSRADRFLYTQLKAHGFWDAHLTDAIKCRGTGEEAKAWLSDDKHHHFVLRQLTYLQEEVTILQPRLVVPMGDECAKLLRQHCPELTHLLPGKAVPHPSWAVRYKREERVKDAMKGIRKLYFGKAPPTLQGPPAYPRRSASSSPQ
jgi:uracil-DNA glycosylase